MDLTKSSRPAERRIEPRKSLRTAVNLSVPGRPPLALRSVDLSASGMCVISDLNIPAGTRCALAFALPLRDAPAAPLQVNAAVAYSVFSHDHDGFKVGLQFSDLPTSATTQLARYMNG